jgi:NAD dependent epimerase/dehydratase family enzyme
VVLDGQRVLPSRAQAAGFQFRYSEVDSALRSILRT